MQLLDKAVGFDFGELVGRRWEGRGDGKYLNGKEYSTSCRLLIVPLEILHVKIAGDVLGHSTSSVHSF